jgi:hypothetical protein
VSDTVSAFGQLQRRYLSEREEELWRLVTLFQEQQKLEAVRMASSTMLCAECMIG